MSGARYVLHCGPAKLVNGSATTNASRIESASAEWEGQRFDARSSHGALCKLARVLVAAGAPDGAWLSLTLAGEPSLFGPSLHDLAKLTVSESDRQGIRFERFHERPDFPRGDAEKPADGAGGYSDSSEAPDRPEFRNGKAGIGMSEPVPA